MYSNWALRSGMCEPLARLAVGLQAVAGLVQQQRHRPRPHAMILPRQFLGQPPRALAGPAQRRLGIAAGHRFQQRLQCRQQSRVGLRQRSPPPPGRRTRTACAARCGIGWSSSRNPAVIVGRDSPVARATSDTPPQPSSRASAAAHCRRLRSSISGSSELIFPLDPCECLGVLHTLSSQILAESPRPICKGYFCASPKLPFVKVSRYSISA